MLTRAILAALVVVVMSGATWAQSQQRAPHTKPVQAQNGPPAQTAASDQRGTDKMPFSVKIVPTPDAEQKAAEAEKERHQELTANNKIADETERLADFTATLAIVTVLLFVAAVFQIGLFWYQLRLIRDGAHDTHLAAIAARDAAKTALDEFAASHRPKIIVHAAEVAWDAHESARPTLGAEVHLFNVGDADATIFELRGNIQIRDATLTAGIMLPEIAIAPMTVKAGEPGSVKIESVHDDRRVPAMTMAAKGNPLLCIGAIRYRDSSGTTRQTGLCYQYGTSPTGDGRWVAYNHPTAKIYNYSY